MYLSLLFMILAIDDTWELGGWAWNCVIPESLFDILLKRLTLDFLYALRYLILIALLKIFILWTILEI